MQAKLYLPCTLIASSPSACNKRKKKKNQIPLAFTAKPTPPSKRSQELDTSDRSERQNSSSQDILLNYAIITVSALE